MFLRHFTFRDGHKAGQARFGSKQIVVGVVGTLRRHVVADGKYLAFRIEQKLEVHLFHDLLGIVREAA